MIPRSAISDPQSSIDVHIERLLLDSLPVSTGQAECLQGAVETELKRLLTERGLRLSTSVAVPRLDGGSIEFTREGEPTHIGREIAQAIHRSIAPARTVRPPTSPNGGAHA
jgi:hypothetical protein